MVMIWITCLGSHASMANDDSAPVTLRAAHFTVPPSTGPVSHVLIKNLTDQSYQGTIRLKLPTSWSANKTDWTVTLNPHETKQLPFVLENAIDLESNRYPVEILAQGPGGRVAHKQDAVCTSAPFFKPKIDGKTQDWADAIPVTFSHQGKKTMISSYWNQDQFCLLVEVEEDKHIGYRKKASAGGFDAIQFALFPKGAVTGRQPAEKAQRYEFLIIGAASRFSADKCFLLISPADTLSLTQMPRKLADLSCKEAKVVVKRRKNLTLYECAIPYAVIPKIRLGVGREIGLALLVHDTQGTGIRDWSEAMNLWATPNPLAWCTIDRIPWGNYSPQVNRITWGLCSSKH